MAARSIWKGAISFGLLNIPVTLHTAEETGSKLHFSMLDRRNLSPIKYKKVNAETGEEVAYEDITKGYEYEKGEFVIVTSEDFRAANVKASETIDIQDFVLLEEIDPLLFEKPYYLVPQKSGTKGYLLLRDALHKSKKVAIAKVVIRTKQHLAAVMVRGDYLVLEILRFAHEVIEENEAHYLDDINFEKGRYSPQELKMATELLDGMTAEWDPDKYTDSYYDDLMKRIEAKVKKGEGHLIEEPEEEVAAPTRNVVDLLPLLKKSLAATQSKGGRSRAEPPGSRPRTKSSSSSKKKPERRAR